MIWRSLLVAVLIGLLPGLGYAQDDTMVFNPVRVQEDPEAEADLREAIKAYKKDDFLRASLLLHRIVARNETAVGPYEQKAEYYLGKTLYRLGLYQASLNFFDRVAQTGPDHRYFRTTCKWLYYLSRKISGDPGLLEKIAKFKPQECPAEFRSELAFLLGQYHYKRGAVRTGLEHLKQVNKKSSYFPKAKFLEGISHVRLDKPAPAVAAFKDLLRTTLEADELTEDLRYFNQLAILSMARVFYSTRQFDKAAKYYDRIPLDSVLWLDALFESSWTHYMSQNHEKALGNLHTLNSPFFKDEYMPESKILEAVTFFSKCSYNKSEAALLGFDVSYRDLLKEVRGYVDSFSEPSELYQFLGKLQDGGSRISPRVGQILKAAFADKTLKRMNAYIRELDRETKLISDSKSQWAKSQLANTIIQDTEVIKSLAVHEAGLLARKRLKRVVSELDELFNQHDRIGFEIKEAERQGLQGKLRGDNSPRKRKRKGSIYATDEEHIYWPFRGEFWRDELGYYLYTIKSECGR